MQRGRPWLAFPLAVLKKYGDDQAGNLAALMAYYAFLSGGHHGNIYVYGIPSFRHITTIPVFTPEPAVGYGIDEESKAMLGPIGASSTPNGTPVRRQNSRPVIRSTGTPSFVYTA